MVMLPKKKVTLCTKSPENAVRYDEKIIESCGLIDNKTGF